MAITRNKMVKDVTATLDSLFTSEYKRYTMTNLTQESLFGTPHRVAIEQSPIESLWHLWLLKYGECVDIQTLIADDINESTNTYRAIFIRLRQANLLEYDLTADKAFLRKLEQNADC